MAGGAIGKEGGLAGGDDFGFGGPLVDERGVVERGKGFLKLGGLGLLDGDDLLFHGFLRGLEEIGVIVEDPLADKPDDGTVEGEEPPVRQFLVVFLDAVVFVFAKDDLALFFCEVTAFWFLAHGSVRIGEVGSVLRGAGQRGGCVRSCRGGWHGASQI